MSSDSAVYLPKKNESTIPEKEFYEDFYSSFNP